MRFRSIVAGFVLSSASLYAHADQVYDFSNVSLSSLASGGSASGTLTGTFTTNDARSTILSYDITTSAAGSFTGFEYTPTDSILSASSLPSQFFQIDSATGNAELRVYFSNGLTASGGTIVPAYSYEAEAPSGIRYPAGSVVAAGAASVTPEPASFALLGTGLLGIAGVVKRRVV